MKNYLSTLALIGSVIAAPAAWAGERTVTFVIDNMTCASCPYIVKTSMAAVAGSPRWRSHSRRRLRP